VQEAMPNHTSALQLVSRYLSDTFSGVGESLQGAGLESEGCCCMDCLPAVACRKFPCWQPAPPLAIPCMVCVPA
jgi:hypothetical protein